MEHLTEKLEKILRTAFPDAELTLTWPEDPEHGKLLGFIVAELFEGHDHLDRQQMLWKVLRRELSKAEQEKIAMIFTETPAEKAALEQ